MTDQPEVTPLSDEEIETLRAERPHPRLPLHQGRTVLLINRLLATIDQLRAELTVSEERCKFLRTQVEDLVASCDSDHAKIKTLRAKVAELEARTLDDASISGISALVGSVAVARGIAKDTFDSERLRQLVEAIIREEIARRKGAK